MSLYSNPPTLWEHQKSLQKSLQSITENTCIQSDTGTGKSVVMMDYALTKIEHGYTVLFIVPTIELIVNLENKLKQFAPLVYKHHYSPINSKIGKFKAGKKIYIGTFGSIAKYQKLFTPDVIIHDECFIEGTLVDNKPIESYKIGDTVSSFNFDTQSWENREVKTVFKNEYRGDLYEIFFDNGRSFTCTANHPIYTLEGWINAENLQIGMVGVFKLSDKISFKSETDKIKKSRKNLQSFENDCYRDRRKFSQHNQETRIGSSERPTFETVRVHSIKIHKQSSGSSMAVYNLEVDRNHNYCVDGILVHNCHHLRAKTWLQHLEFWYDKLHIGFTATPIRYDGKSLKKYLPNLICSESTEWFVSKGVLAPYRVFADPDTVRFVATSGGDHLDEQQDLFNNYDLVAKAFRTWQKHAYGQQTMTFATGEKHAYSLKEEYGDHARVITGKTLNRDRLLKEFEQGEYNVLISIDLFFEGVDVQGCSCVQWCRSTGSLSRFRQGNGRGLRRDPKNSNKVLTILDHAGNIRQHGEPSLEIDWEELYNSAESSSIPNFDKESLDYVCSSCTYPIAKLSEVKGQQTIVCPLCQHVNVIKALTGKQRHELGINEDVELVEFNIPLSIQEISRIINNKKMPFQAKRDRILGLKKAHNEQILAGLIQLGIDEQLAKIYISRRVR